MLILTVQTPITLDIASFCNLFLQGLGETHGYGSSSRSCSKGFALEGAESSAPLQTDKYKAELDKVMTYPDGPQKRAGWRMAIRPITKLRPLRGVWEKYVEVRISG